MPIGVLEVFFFFLVQSFPFHKNVKFVLLMTSQDQQSIKLIRTDNTLDLSQKAKGYEYQAINDRLDLYVSITRKYVFIFI